jgi:hypothetical protein
MDAGTLVDVKIAADRLGELEAELRRIAQVVGYGPDGLALNALATHLWLARAGLVALLHNDKPVGVE